MKEEQSAELKGKVKIKQKICRKEYKDRMNERPIIIQQSEQERKQEMRITSKQPADCRVIQLYVMEKS